MDLRLPKSVSITGSIAEIKALEGAEYEVLRRDTTVVILVDLNDQLHTVWVSDDQKREYALEAKLFIGNIITVELNENVEGETYYVDANDEKVPHEATFNSFVGMVNTPAFSLHMKGVPQFIIDKIEAERTSRERSVAKPAARFHASRANADASERITVLVDKLEKTSNPLIKENIKGMLLSLGWVDPDAKTEAKPKPEKTK